MTENEYYANLSKAKSLQHHGIGGMKWGKKNGPPYPLGASEHSASEKKAGTSGWTKEAKKEAKKKRETARDKAKTLSDEELKKDNARQAMERQYEKNHKDDYEDGVDRAWKATENAKETVRGAKDLANTVDRATRKQVSTSNIDISKLSDQELQKIVNRMNLENNYYRLTTVETRNKGIEYVTNALDVIGSLVAMAGGAVLLAQNLKKLRR